MGQDRVLQHEKSIYEEGYGMVSKRLMLDQRITAQAKAIYSFFAVHGNNESFPGMEYMAANLGMNKDTCREHRDYLEAYGYITIRQERKEGNKFDNNVYVIEQFPKERAELIKKIEDRIEKRKKKSKKTAAKKAKKEPKKVIKKADEPAPVQGNQPYPEKPGTEKPDTEKPGTNHTSLNHTSLNQTSNKNLSILKYSFDPKTEQLLLNNEDRLTDYLLKRIEKIYKVYSHDLNRFHRLLGAALLKGRNVASYLETSLINPDREQTAAAAPGKATREEQRPEWLGKEQQQEEEDEEVLKAAAELKAKMKGKYNRKQA